MFVSIGAVAPEVSGFCHEAGVLASRAAIFRIGAQESSIAGVLLDFQSKGS
jgi:hypothetical protein